MVQNVRRTHISHVGSPKHGVGRDRKKVRNRVEKRKESDEPVCSSTVAQKRLLDNREHERLRNACQHQSFIAYRSWDHRQERRAKEEPQLVRAIIAMEEDDRAKSSRRHEFGRHTERELQNYTEYVETHRKQK